MVGIRSELRRALRRCPPRPGPNCDGSLTTCPDAGLRMARSDGTPQYGMTMDTGRARSGARRAMSLSLDAGWAYGALIVVLTAWILHGFIESLLAACVTAIASWPLYRQFAARLPGRMARSATPVLFTSVDDGVRAGTVDVRGRCAARGSPRTGAGDRDRGPDGHRGSRLAGERAARRALARRSLGERARAPGRALRCGPSVSNRVRSSPGHSRSASSWRGTCSSSCSRSSCCASCIRRVKRWRRESGERCVTASASGPKSMSTSPRGRCARP